MSRCIFWAIFITVFLVLFFFVGLPLILVFTVHGPKDPTFTVESSVVKAYNITSDNRLFCIIEFSIRAHNPNSKDTIGYYGVDLEVRKGKHHKLADDGFKGFSQKPGGDTVVQVEAVGLYVKLKKKIVEELKEDSVAGEGRVNIFMSGELTGFRDGDGITTLNVACKNVVVDFWKSTVMIQSVNCRVKVHVYYHDDDD